MEEGKAGREIVMPPGRRSDSAAAAKRGVKQGDRGMDEEERRQKPMKEDD